MDYARLMRTNVPIFICAAMLAAFISLVIVYYTPSTYESSATAYFDNFEDFTTATRALKTRAFVNEVATSTLIAVVGTERNETLRKIFKNRSIIADINARTIEIRIVWRDAGGAAVIANAFAEKLYERYKDKKTPSPIEIVEMAFAPEKPRAINIVSIIAIVAVLAFVVSVVFVIIREKLFFPAQEQGNNR